MGRLESCSGVWEQLWWDQRTRGPRPFALESLCFRCSLYWMLYREHLILYNARPSYCTVQALVLSLVPR